jgi:aryl-alcohol dehydrogenase-like predicted oxidoreductase
MEGHGAARAETAVTVPYRQLGGIPVHPIGLGTMPLSVPGRPGEDQAVATIHAALGAGVNLLDTADAYSEGERDVGAGERLIARALRGVPEADRPLVATKGGHTRPGGRWELDGRPEYLRAACEASLRALETDRIDLYQLHRPDPATPFAESVGALRELLDEGKIRLVGLSNVTVAQLEEAEAIVEVAAVQNELSLGYVAPIENGEVAACAERGIPLLAWSPLGGASGAAGAGSGAVGRIAGERGVSPQRVVLAWLLSLSPTVLPIPGSRRPETILDSVAAAELELGADELRAITRDAVGDGSVIPGE